MKTLSHTFLFMSLIAGLFAAPTMAKISIVSSTTDLASIARLIGGDLVDVQSICAGAADPHFVEVLPSYMIKVKKARIYLKVGLDLDRWADQIIDGSRNGKIVVVDCAQRIAPANVPTGKVDASMGDIHPQGNPHYWLAPENGIIIAEDITNALIRVDSDNAGAYKAGLQHFKQTLAEYEPVWKALAATLAGQPIVTYHDTWPYFANAFGIEIAGFVEPKPGVEPTPSHTATLVKMIKARDIHVIGIEPYFSRRTPDTISRETGARVVTLPPSVGGAPGANDYFSLFDVLLKTLRDSSR